MKTHTSNSEYKLLVLLDKSKASRTALSNAVNLAKLINGKVDIFQVAKPVSVVNNSNQIAALRAIDEQRVKHSTELKKLADIITEEENIPVNYSFTIGNVKKEIEKHITKTNPDIVVIGKRKKNSLKIFGDKLTKQLIYNYKGGIMISNSKDDFTSYNNKSIGFLNEIDELEKLKLTNHLKSLTNKPSKVFKIVPSGKTISDNTNIEKNKIVYEFDANNNGDEMTNFISNNDLSVLCINNKQQNGTNLFNSLDKTLTNTLEKTNVPILILNQN